MAVSEEPPARVAFYGRFYLSPGKTSSQIDRKALRYISKDWPLARPIAVDALAEAAREAGLSSGTIGVDEEGMSFDMFSDLSRALPRARVVRASGLLKKIRMVKTSHEVELLRLSTGCAERGIEVGLASIGEGTTEASLARAIQIEIARHAEPGIVNAYGGADSAYVLRAHREVKIKKGDQIWLDEGCYSGGYCSDTGTTAVRGIPSEKLKRYHQAVVRGQRKAIEAIRTGARPSRLHRIAVDEVRKTIPDFRRDQVGHGLGLEHYEPPALSAREEAPLEEGMVVNVETPYYEVGFGGLMVEDTVLVKEDGCEFLTKMDKDLRTVN